ncbi:LysR family transcriptional regulator [Paenibacillus macquariensis]|uniref:DNA-binding transcriptional regulator, LysR family n=1 Tax=Paenibacillus macquariensis TaxID=948756 RepID=A0ABY1JUY5_9BACL|nr:LysR family transcriptional regulator [Paenibacillus macquariensis]MEC0090867.1 LysR family transcriptional regulator [Paenibacillus macquariensis]OAB34599.1 transcriptional regulator [Paenibacillus macquariensis subsp. macquariensis]SIQ81788.1 DNA-binding transcriptional regulator, LysR family [Paenibacillus macquariensis]
MELRQLEYFVAICKEMHFSRAAENICTTQSNLSQQIKFLENELGLPLFDRIGKRIKLTEAGKIMLEQSQKIFEQVDYAKRAISDLKKMEGGRLDIGILPGDGDLLFDALLIDFHKTYPKLAISVTETVDVYEQVLNGTRDLGVTTLPLKPDERISIIPLFHEEFVLAIRSDHPLAKSKALPFEQLQQLKMVMFSSEHQISKVLQSCCDEKGIAIDNSIVSSTLSTLVSLIEQGIGASILPRMLLDYMNNDKIVAVKLLHPTPSQDICILYRTDKFMGQAAKIFIQELQSFLQNVINQTGRSLG